MIPIKRLPQIRIRTTPIGMKGFMHTNKPTKINNNFATNKITDVMVPVSSKSFFRFTNRTKKVESNSRTSGHSEHDVHHPFGGVHGAKHQLQHRMKEKVGMKVAEKTVHVLPRLLRIKKRLGTHLIARKLLRGVAIAVPAIGGIFACVVTYTDSKRAFLESSRGNVLPARLFGLAAGCDIIDAGAHLYTATGLLGVHAGHVHTAEGIHLGILAYFHEELSLVAAVIATSAAIAGEWYTPTIEHPSHSKHIPSPDSPNATHEGHHLHKTIVGHSSDNQEQESQTSKNT